MSYRKLEYQGGWLTGLRPLRPSGGDRLTSINFTCKFWMKDNRGCYRNDFCKYLHKPCEKGINIKCVNKKYDNPQTEVQKEVKTNVIEEEEEINELVDNSNKNASNIVEIQDSIAGGKNQKKPNQVKSLQAEIVSINKTKS